MPSLRTTLLLSISLAALFVLPAITSAASYYVSPNGGGSMCTTAAPCSLDEGLNRAGGGDEVVLMDGRYRGLDTHKSGSDGNPITIRAANRHKAIVEWPHSGHLFGTNFDIRHSNIVVRGIQVDGRKLSWDNLTIHGGGPGSLIRNIVIEDMHVVNSGHMNVGMFSAENVVFRHNLLEDSGNFSEDGEGFYLTSHNGNQPLVNAEIYGNVIRNITANFIDYKGQARNVNVHHNIFERHRDDKDGWCGDGLVRTEGNNSAAGNYFQDNIVRDSPDTCYMIRISSNRVDILNNVFYNIGGDRVYSYEMMSGPIISGNVFCNTPSDSSRGSNNRFNAPQSVCDAEVARITQELKSLPGAGSGFPQGGFTTFTPGPCSLYPAGSANYSPYGLHWDWTSAQKALMLQATCETDTTTLNIGNGRETGSGATMAGLTYVYHQGHYNSGSGPWTPYTLQCSGSDKTKIANVWCKGSAAASLPTSARWFVAYTCIWTGAKWQCGCTTTACATSFWQVQGINR